MQPIQGLKCIYDTGSRGWAIELALGGETPVRRFDVDGPEDAEMLIEAFEESTASTFDPVTGEIVFSYEYASLDADEDDAAEEDEAEEDGADDGETASGRRRDDD